MAHLKYVVTASICFLLSFLLLRLALLLSLEWSFAGIIAVSTIGVMIFVNFVLGVIYLFIATRRVSKHHSILSVLIHFILRYYMLYVGKKYVDILRRNCLISRSTQESRIHLIMSKNQNTDYGRKFNLKDIHSLTDLQRKHPLTTYDHYKPFVQRVAKGDKNVMTVEPITRLLLTSGTTGEGKQIPLDIFQMLKYIGVCQQIQSEVFTDVQPMQKQFRIHCNTKIIKSECGIEIAAGSVVDKKLKRTLVFYSTPPDGLLIENIDDAFYVHFLFALREKDLGSIFATFTSILVDGFKYLEQHWPEMVKDITDGTINAKLNIPPTIREALTHEMREGDTERAEEVRRECEKGQHGIMQRLWPNMRSVTAIDNVGLREAIMQNIGNGLQVYSMLYGCSEGMIGYNLNPLQHGEEEYVLNITEIVFEFINEDDIYEDNPKTFLIDEIEVGKKYEVVISQLWGLYRYRFGDVIQVTGFYQTCPKVKFLYRIATLLNLFGEKVDQVVIVDSLSAALEQWPEVTLKHYCVAESPMVSVLQPNIDEKRSKAHYVFFLEMEADQQDNSMPAIDKDKLAQQIDENIRSRHQFYRTFRDNKKISDCKVCFVKSGAFEQLKSFVLQTTTAVVTQVKMPLKLRTNGMTRVMLDNVL